jgi:hypothetical protein
MSEKSNKEFQKSISFGTSEELKEKREREFLSLDPGERFERFLMMIQESYIMFGRKESSKDNFIIKYKDASRF